MFVCPSADGPEMVAITPPNPPPFLRAGSNFSLSCAAQSSPPATFVWYHNNTMMEAGGPVLTLETIEKHKFGKTTGEYTCRAANAKTMLTVSSPVVSFAVMGEWPDSVLSVNDVLSSSWWDKVRWSVVVHRTFLEIWFKTEKRPRNIKCLCTARLLWSQSAGETRSQPDLKKC